MVGHSKPLCSVNTSYVSFKLTIDLVFLWGIGMEDIQWSNKVSEINDTLPLHIKQIEYLHVESVQNQVNTLPKRKI